MLHFKRCISLTLVPKTTLLRAKQTVSHTKLTYLNSQATPGDLLNSFHFVATSVTITTPQMVMAVLWPILTGLSKCKKNLLNNKSLIFNW